MSWMDWFKGHGKKTPERNIYETDYPTAMNPYGGVDWEKSLEKVCNLFISENRDLTAAMAGSKVFPREEAYEEAPFDAPYSPTKAMDDLAPLFADLYLEGSESTKLKRLVDKFEPKVKDNYREFATLTVGLVESLAEKEGKTKQEVYGNLSKQLFPKHEGENYRAFVLAGHTLGINGLPYYTEADIFATLYGEAEQTDFEKSKAIRAAKDLYRRNHDNEECLVALADQKVPIAADILDNSVTRGAYDLIWKINPEVGKALKDAKETYGERKYVSDFVDRAGNRNLVLYITGEIQPPISREAIDETKDAYKNFEAKEEVLKTWYEKIHGETKTKKVEYEISDSVGEESEALALASRVLTAQKNKDPYAERAAIKGLEILAYGSERFKFVGNEPEPERKPEDIILARELFENTFKGRLEIIEPKAKEMDDRIADLVADGYFLNMDMSTEDAVKDAESRREARNKLNKMVDALNFEQEKQSMNGPTY